MATVEESPILATYYAILRGGAEQYGEGEKLLPLLSDSFVFDGPIAGRMEGAARFTIGVRGFIETVVSITMLHVVLAPKSAATLYDATLPSGRVRFAEFFEFEADRIRELRIHYAGSAYLAAGGR